VYAFPKSSELSAEIKVGVPVKVTDVPKPPPPPPVGKGKRVKGKAPKESDQTTTESVVVPASKSDKGKKPLDSKPVLAQENPLRAKGVPRTQGLTEDQKKSLRKFFKVPTDPLPSKEELASMDKVQKTALLSKYTLPKWAVTAVSSNPGNLARIVKKELTKDNFGQNRLDHGSSCSDEWKAVKSRFPDVVLESKPRTSKGKALLKEYLGLKKKWGDDTSLPRLSLKGKGPTGDSSVVKKGKVQGQGQKDSIGSLSLMDGVNLMAAFAKAFR
jgi:hypothetical protein